MVDSLRGSFMLSSLTVSSGSLPSDQVDLFRLHSFKQVTATSEYEHFPARDILDERKINGWSPNPYNQSQQHLTVTFSEPLNAHENPYLTAMLVFGKGSHLIASNFKFFAMTGVDDGTNLPVKVQQTLSVPAEHRSTEQSALVRDHFLSASEATASWRTQIDNIQDRLISITEKHPTMVMRESSTPRETHILNRGQYDQPLNQVDPGVPSVFASLPNSGAMSRLELAQWLIDSENPLTARVTVNQLWQLLFGTGLVSTPADFGAQGALPTHPELLDWLAVEFIESDWDTKYLIKKLVMSATYRQRSSTSPKLLNQDPNNTYLSRGPRFRLQAEFIRDAALQVSGLLSDRVGGPSVKPYQPAGLWKEVSHYGSTPATAQVFVQDKGEKLYRRSMYTYWKRTAPPPSMLTFDAPNRELCTIKRESTNTPLQALVLLNDPQFVEASRHLASRVLQEIPSDESERIQTIFNLVLNRDADSFELNLLKNRLREEYQHYEEHPDEAIALLSVGDSAYDKNLNITELACWTILSSVVMNLSENITRG